MDMFETQFYGSLIKSRPIKAHLIFSIKELVPHLILNAIQRTYSHNLVLHYYASNIIVFQLKSV